MRRVWRVAMLGCLVAACAKEHDGAPPRTDEPRERDAGVAGAGGGARGEGGRAEPAPVRGSDARPEPEPPAADGGKLPAIEGSTALAVLVPTEAHAAEIGDGAVGGTARFRQGAASVDLYLQIRGCASRTQAYPVFVLEGSDCSEATLLGAHWDGDRGAGIAGVQCIGTAGNGRVAYSRSNEADRWSIGSPARTNLIGHALAIYDPQTGAPLACGVIELEQRAPTDQPAAPTPPLDRAAPIAGLCLAGMIVRDSAHACPDPTEIVACASAHCDLNACVEVCSSFIDCLNESDDPCSRQFICDIDQPCSDCYGAIQTCSLNFCGEVYACAAPSTPDGPCSKLEACCALQGDQAPMCLETIQAVKKFSGDPSCIGIMQDWDFFSHLRVPCEFE